MHQVITPTKATKPTGRHQPTGSTDATAPEVSIIIPVFNTGPYLQEAVDSVLGQQPTSEGSVPRFELILIDDASTDAVTLELLERLPRLDPRIVVLQNQRRKGAAGARNSGILRCRGAWLAFLDSDDVWTKHSLALRWQEVRGNPQARWVAGRFRIWKPQADHAGVAVFPSLSTLWQTFDTPQAPAEFKRLEKPVQAFSRSCFIGIISVLMQRSLVLEQGLFDESLLRSEDYHLWFKCALDHDLWMTEADVSFYRIHPASLTHGDAPRFLHEDRMIELLLRSPRALAYRNLFLRRFDLVMQDTCYFYREHRLFGKAFGTGWQWLRKRPSNLAAWKELTACCLRAA